MWKLFKQRKENPLRSVKKKNRGRKIEMGESWGEGRGRERNTITNTKKHRAVTAKETHCL